MSEETLENKKEKRLSFWNFLSTIKWLFAFNFKISPWAATTQIIVRIFIDVSPLFNALIFAKILDKAILILNSTNSNLTDIFPILTVLLIFNLIIASLNDLYTYVQGVMSSYVSFGVQMILAEKVNSLGIQTLEDPNVVNKIQRAKETIGMTNSDYERVIVFFSRVVVLISVSYVIFRIMPVIAVIIILVTIPDFVQNRIFMKKNWKLWREKTEDRRIASSSASTLNETTDLQEINITSSFRYLGNIFYKYNYGYVKDSLKILKKWVIFSNLTGSLTSVAGIFGYFMILKNLFYKIISVGDVTFQMRTLDMFTNNLTNVVNSFGGLYERAIRINEVKVVFDMESLVDDGNIELPKQEIATHIKFENVSFKYPNTDKFVIKKLNLDIKPGQKIAIVGENGAGKTTVVKLLSRFYRVDSGSVLLNDININDISIKSWYKNLGVLFQDYNTYPYLTLKENIYMGRSDQEVNMEKLQKAMEQANVNSFAKDYKNGVDQVLSEKYKGGTRPSTGQWQKIAIARFFYRDSPVVVFDEPTASIDAVSEAEIFGKIYDFFTGKTVIIISHRFSTVRNADKIYVLDKGEIVESGNHDELMKLKGKYYKAFNIQAKGYK